MDQTDIWRAAFKMIEIYGLDAGWRSAMRADHFLDQGDIDGCNTWKSIVKAIIELQRELPNLGEQRH